MVVQASHGFVGERAVRAAAVRDDFHVGGELTEPCVEFVKWYRTRARNVSGFVLEGRAYVDHDDLACHGSATEFVAVDGLDVGVVAEVSTRCGWHLGDAVRGDGSERGDEPDDVVAGKAVVDASPFPARVDELRAAQFLELRRDGGHAVPGDAGELVDAAFPLREQVNEFEAGRVRDRLGDPGQLLEERPLRRCVTHCHLRFRSSYTLLIRGILDKSTELGLVMSFEIVSVVDEGLGHSGHLVAVDGRVLVIDPLRVVEPYLAVIEQHGWRLTWTADTHTHADYVSGSPELARRGATFFASRAAHLEVSHQPLDPGDEVDLGGLTLRALPTPGHTPDHLAYLLLDGDRPVAVFTGGSLMVGTVGRPDLLGPEHARELARAMWQSLQGEVLVLPDTLPVYPTHGAGSFCSTPGTNERTTTIGREKATNALLQLPDEDTFVRQLVGGLGSLPTYFSWLPERNRQGLGPPPSTPLRGLSVEEAQRLIGMGAEVIDVRPVPAFAAHHIPGSLSNALRPVFASWLGWLVTPDRQIIFVADDTTDRDELVRQCANIGYDNIAGELTGGIDAWIEAGLPTESLELVAVEQLTESVLDVRLASEYHRGHVPGARNIELGSLAEVADEISGPITVMCGHGERAATAASILARRGHPDVCIVTGGPDDWARVTGRSLQIER